MAGEMQFDLVSPERQLASLKAREVSLPGAEGDMTVMEGHVPTITTLRPGIVRAEGGEGAREFVVTEGFVEITADAVSVIAERASPRDAKEARALVEAALEEARRKADGADDEAKSAAEKFVGDLTDLLEMMV